MTPERERWRRAQALFHAALEHPPETRERFVAERAADDPALASEVLSLLAEDARTDSPLDRDLGELAHGALAGDAAAVPREIGPYRLRELLGEGGMGVVYLAERTDLRSLVAIKILRDAWLSPARRERFASEQRTLAQLNHPSIARLYDADTLPDGAPWFAMEYVDGFTLTRYCETRRCTIRRMLELIRAVGEAVLHAHQHAVIHRDLKPSNILVTHGGQPKLLDFGIAKQLEGLDARGDRTRTELRLMTPAYAAPEQVRGAGQGVHTDVYALGAILYELLTGRPPFVLEGLTPGEAAERIVRQVPDRPSAVVARLARGEDAATASSRERRRALQGERGTSWSDLDVLCLTALQKDPERRYRSVDSLIRDVDHYLRGEPLEARPDTWRYRTGKFTRRHWRPLAATAAVVLTVIGLTAVYTVRLTRARNAAQAEAERTRTIQEFMTRLFQGGDPDAGPTDTLRVVTLLDRGLHDAHAFDHQPAIQAELYQTLGGIYQTLGSLEPADSALSAALAIRRERLGPTHPDMVRSLMALGLLRADQSRFDEAERLERDALVLAHRREGSDPAAVARVLTALGEVLDGRGDYARAVAVLEEAARRDSASGLPPAELWGTLNDLANAHYYLGHLAVAESLDRRGLALDRALHGARHPNVAADLMNLGSVEQQREHWPAAERDYRDALAIYRGWFGEDHFETASALTAVARTLIRQDKGAEAGAMLKRALAVRERIYGPVHPGVALTLNEMGLLAQRQGQLAEAEADFRRMIEIDRAAYHDRHSIIGLAYSNLGGVLTLRKRYDEAERCFREALRRYQATLPPGHLNFGITRIKLGRALLRAGRVAEAERESRAGYEIVAHQAEPSDYWLRDVRTDLIAEYESLGRPAEAARFRASSVDPARADGPVTTAAR